MSENRCRICGRLYPPDVQSCDDCHVFLPAQDTLAPDQAGASSPGGLVRLINLPSYQEALVLANVLRSEGIDPVVQDDLLINTTLGDTSGIAGGVSILVGRADLDHAREVLKLH